MRVPAAAEDKMEMESREALSARRRYSKQLVVGGVSGPRWGSKCKTAAAPASNAVALAAPAAAHAIDNFDLAAP